MTRPTDWTTSTGELRGERNRTASRAGTSTPSDKQRTLLRTRQTSSPASSFSQLIFDSFSVAFMLPSTCCDSQISVDESSPESCWYSSMTVWNISLICFDETLCVLLPVDGSMTWQNATAFCIGLVSPLSSSASPCLLRAFQQPMMRAASSTFSWLLSSLSRFCSRWET